MIDVVVALFKENGESEMFDVEDFCMNGESLQLNIYESQSENDEEEIDE